MFGPEEKFPSFIGSQKEAPKEPKTGKNDEEKKEPELSSPDEEFEEKFDDEEEIKDAY